MRDGIDASLRQLDKALAEQDHRRQVLEGIGERIETLLHGFASDFPFLEKMELIKEECRNLINDIKAEVENG